MAAIHGHCDPAFSRVRELLQDRVRDGDELGASLCVTLGGRTVIDLWGGHADVARTRPWEEDTITAIWSSSKVVTNLAALLLVSRGLLDPDAPVSTYWPEFAANGKEQVLVSHILSHSSGVSAWEAPITLEEIYDIPTSTAKLAQQPSWWTPGEHSGYHLANQAHLVGELVRRVTGQPLHQFIADELAGPLGADVQLGVPERDWPRTAEMIPPPPLALPDLGPASVAARSFAGTPFPPEAPMTPAFRHSRIGHAGFANARALARIGSIVALGGTVDGRQYLTPATVARMLQEHVSGPDLVLFARLRFGLGVGLPVPQTLPWLPEGRIGFWCGWGGSSVVMDTGRRMSIGYVMNRMGEGTLGNDRIASYVQAIYEAVNALPSGSVPAVERGEE
ncbi:beta-lactamase/transpeptidase-like protein [Aspergillus heteromorphus CBS 117.55]|uniref:Beta-lactamase/transpeptidase-like protein n=1 Tax=Aspergillus heteromorphus CBS 117.55 TaxID=1448321 RepID=A0A317VDA7_9EURO|nr:beta-lactamase/transpeptidase-like protein [Aspergillus heteromorphus CBS 117.55]PWY72256.1 beta-lactamase/transpeptidase-like protein [Aspergillus heteromorphus CBS 117.55]